MAGAGSAERRGGVGAARLAAAFAFCLGPAPAGATSVDWLRETIEAADIGSLALSPDGRRLAFRTSRADIGRNLYVQQWNIVDLDTGRSRIAGDAGEAIILDPGLVADEPPIWSPDGRWIYYRALHGGEVQVWRSAADGSARERVTAEPGDIETAEPAGDGSGIRLGIGPGREEIERAEALEYDQGILADGHVDLGQNVYRGAIINGRPRSQRLTGKWFERGGILRDRPLRGRLLKFGSHQLLEAPPPDPATTFAEEPSRQSALGETAALRPEDGRPVLKVSGEQGMHRCDARACTSDRISWFGWRPGKRQLLFASSGPSHRQTIWKWDLPSKSVSRVAQGPGLMSGSRSAERPCAISASELICVTASAGAPPRLEAIAMEKGYRRILFDPNAELRARRWPLIEQLEWEDKEGRSFTGILFSPRLPSAGKPPLFINYYRCEGFIRGGVGDEWPFAALAEAGIASVCINAALTHGPQDGIGQYRTALSGIEALISTLGDRQLIDAGRVGIGGLSFGSEVAMWTIIHSDLIAAASLASPQFEPTAYWFNNVRGRDYAETLRKVWGLGTPDETAAQWKLVSPALNADRIRAPLLMQLSEQEARYAVELRSRLSRSETPFELHVFPDEPHIKVQPRHRLSTYQRNLDWFRFWLAGQEDASPDKAGQYERWRTLQRAQARSQSSSEARSNIRK